MRNFNRRSFLQVCKALSAGSVLASFSKPSWSQQLHQALKAAAHKSPEQLASDENFWHYVRQAYTNNTFVIDLNSAGMAPSPRIVQEAMKSHADYCNEVPSYNLNRVVNGGKEHLRQKLARLCDCKPNELAILRNATEALEIVIQGLPLKAGDEVVVCKQDYTSTSIAWRQREQRDGIKLVWVDLQMPSEDNEYLANAYIKAFTAKTKLVQITHMINWTGQILPVRKIADAAHKQGIEVIVDGAQSLGQIPVSVPELGADYFGASLHKWLSAPIGTGLLVVKKEKIQKLVPLFSSANWQSDDITKFEHIGTHPVYIEQAIHKAIEFYEMIGKQRKEQRLLYLKNYWMSALQQLPNIEFSTSMKPGFGCAIGMVNVKGKRPADLEYLLVQKYKLHCIRVEYEGIKGVRISPNVYTSLEELDLLVEAIKTFAG